MSTEFFEKVVRPSPFAGSAGRTLSPLTLREIDDLCVKKAYDDAVVKELYDLLNVDQEITIYPPPLFTISPGIRVYRASDIVKFKGYLSSFERAGFDEGGEPEATITITPTAP